MSNVVDIINKIDYLTLDDAIKQLEMLKEQYGGKCVIDIGSVPIPHNYGEIPYVNLIIN